MKKSSHHHFLVIWVILLWGTRVSLGGPFTIVNRISDLDPGNAGQLAILNALNQAADNIESQINSGFLSTAERQGLAERISRANASSDSSLIGDRASNPTQFSAGLGIQGNFYYEALGNKTTSASNQLPSLGVAGQVTLLVGTTGPQLGLPPILGLDPKRMLIFFNAMKFTTSVAGIKVSMFNLGANAFYKFLEPASTPLLAKWGGLTIGTGLNLSSNTITYSAQLSQESQVDVAGETATVTSQLDYTIGIDSLNFFIPIEISTNASIFYFLTVYVGAAADINIGSSKMVGQASGPISAAYSQATGVPNLFSGTAALNLDDGVSAGPPLLMFRGFGGVQLNLSLLKFVVEGAWTGNGSLSGSAQIRFAM